MQPEVERFGQAGKIEVRSDGEKHTISGYAATFDTESNDLGGFREIIRAGAFNRALSEGHDVVARAHHRSEHLLGRVSNGTLRLSIDKRGLRYEVDVPNTTAGRDTLEYIKRGDITESSFAFSVPKGGQKWEGKASDGMLLRELMDVDLVDVAPVIHPAYPATEVSARALEEAKAAVRPPRLGVPMELNRARLKMESQ
jgi:HK97 family phage prohead protease